MSRADTVVILDFETTGLSPDVGDRAIEIGAVRVVNGKIQESFQELMNPGRRITGFIEGYTGITNAMIKDAPPCAEVMHRFADFLGNDNVVAHNASFDKRFLDAELSNIHRSYQGQFACSMLAARRLYQDAPNHKLGTLVEYANLSGDGVFHRALYDSEMTAKLWLTMLSDISGRYEIASIPFKLLLKLTKTPTKSVDDFFEKYAETAGVR
ncbi:MAG: DNA polymerase-3 subunit epsilon [Phenylobacterium sp.]|jgi:DNA polymerase-3 subunit epsilon